MNNILLLKTKFFVHIRENGINLKIPITEELNKLSVDEIKYLYQFDKQKLGGDNIGQNS